MNGAPRGLFLMLGWLLAAAPELLRGAEAVRAPHGIVASGHALASEAGVSILRKGGNAVDAAVATAFALEVTLPSAGNLGGGGFMMIHTSDGRDTMIDYRETAPACATRDMYLAADGSLLTGPGSSTFGWRASGTPGTVAGLALAFERYGSGKVTWSDVVEPARRLAAEGWPMTPGVAASLERASRQLEAFDETRRIYLNGGVPPREGERWRQPDLADTLRRIQTAGPRDFYEGETARRIVAAMAAHGGTITAADLRGYRPVERVPLRGSYRGYTIVTTPPPSSGGVALLQMLGMLEPHDVAALGADSAARYHLFTEAMRRAFRDREEYLGDPDFLPVPVAGLLRPSYVQGLMAGFDPARATPSLGLAPGHPEGADALEAAVAHRGRAAESHETTHFTVVDASGGAVSNTYTLNGAFGSAVTIPGTGILMNNEMDDFAAKPGSPNMFGLSQGEADAVAAGRRPLSSMTPTFVLKDGKLLLATGSPGGPTIINTVLEVITDVIDLRMPVADAVAAPRFHHQWLPDTVSFEDPGESPAVLQSLRAMGHTVVIASGRQGDAETVMIDLQTGQRLGSADPRMRDAKAVGY